jgi:TatD DNase family protein
MISPSSTIQESQASLSLLKSATEEERNDIHIKTTVGVHPYHCKSDPTSEEMDQLRHLLNEDDNKQYISCIGETGLDYSDGFPDEAHQLPWFISQLNLALEYNLPVFLHERLAFEDTLRCIDEAFAAAGSENEKKLPNIIVHCFTGSFNECVEYMKRGYFISVSGYILKEAGIENNIRQCLREGIIPLDRLMIETDSPYMGFAGNKDAFFDAEGESFSGLASKKRKRLKSIYPNVPCALSVVLKAVCEDINVGREERGEDSLPFEELARITTENAKLFFGL